MKSSVLTPSIHTVMTIAIFLFLASCSTPQGNVGPLGASNMWVGAAYRQEARDEAILIRRSVHNYHFRSGSAELNPLGQRDLNVLVEDLRTNRYPINLVKSGRDQELTNTRLSSLEAYLRDNGIQDPSPLVRVGLPGGPGMSWRTAQRLAQSGSPSTSTGPGLKSSLAATPTQPPPSIAGRGSSERVTE